MYFYNFSHRIKLARRHCECQQFKAKLNAANLDVTRLELVYSKHGCKQILRDGLTWDLFVSPAKNGCFQPTKQSRLVEMLGDKLVGMWVEI